MNKFQMMLHLLGDSYEVALYGALVATLDGGYQLGYVEYKCPAGATLREELASQIEPKSEWLAQQVRRHALIGALDVRACDVGLAPLV